jgi:phosphopantothenoylcysteine decarboxylase/phosphopantothenate--cysteine ligase
MRGTRVVLGVTGGIAAYKAALLARLLVAEGAVVDVVLSRGARSFIGAATFEGITGRRVRSEVWEDVSDGTHVQLGRGADVMVVYPATAHTIAKLAVGLADDLLTSTILAHRGPVLLAPAMHTEMWTHPATVANTAVLRERGVHVIGPDSGALMGGDEGVGRVAAPEDVLAEVSALVREGAADAAPLRVQTHLADPYAGLRLVVTAAGTREPLDPVRYLGNRSSGRMGFAIAEAAAARGAIVTLISGPSALVTPEGVQRVDVGTAVEMDAAVRASEAGADVLVMAAAVADFRPRVQLDVKWRRTDGPPVLELVANPDILAGAVERRAAAQRPVIVGFAAQTGDLEAEARAKLAAKRVDLLVANDVSQSDIGFDTLDNAVLLLRADGELREVPKAPKRVIAEIVLDALLPLILAKK